jgi:hypothetical protein
MYITLFSLVIKPKVSVSLLSATKSQGNIHETIYIF